MSDMPLTHSDLLHFIGTSRYYRFSKMLLLTDGIKYLCEQTGCFWLVDAITTHLDEIGNEDWFVTIKLLIANSNALLIYEDGNGYEHARQEIGFTDFPLEHMTLYCCWDGSHWVLMLPSEY
jgi:hypothetical protein